MQEDQTFSAVPHLGQERQVMTAWDRFLRGAELPPHAVRTVIERSWSRCHSAGVDPGRVSAQLLTPDEDLGRLRHRHRDLLDVSVPVMEQARQFLSESGAMMILTDPAGVILRTEGHPATLDAAQDVRLVSGASWDELACGTNAIGTALSLGEPVNVHATEHFCESIQPWSCSATVVRDPTHGEVLGVLDVSGLSGSFHRHWLTVALLAAGRIEADLAIQEMEARYRLATAGLERLSKASATGVIFFDRKGRLVKVEGATPRSLAAIGARLDWQAGLRIESFDADGGRHAGGAALPDWLRPEWVEPVVRGGHRLGTMVVLPESLRREAGQRIVRSRATTPTPGGTSTSQGPIVGESAALRQALDRVRQLADLDVPVLLQGETGVGKEMFARAIHEGRGRTSGPFVPLNCGGLPRDILASELFGYAAGAFTGARPSGMVGKIEAANGGTLFLDEIGEMPLDLQPYFLRVLEGGEVYPLGESKPRRAHFRLIVATNKDLRAEVTAGRFRQDLFYRVSGTALRLPALRERKEDIPGLVEHYSREVSRRHGVPVKPFEPDVMDALGRYAWPGNVRELRNVVEGMATLATGDTVTVADLPEEIASSNPAGRSPLPAAAERAAVTDLSGVEREAIGRAIVSRRGNLTLVARELRISKSTLYVKIEKYGLEQTVLEARRHRP